MCCCGGGAICAPYMGAAFFDLSCSTQQHSLCTYESIVSRLEHLVAMSHDGPSAPDHTMGCAVPDHTVGGAGRCFKDTATMKVWCCQWCAWHHAQDMTITARGAARHVGPTAWPAHPDLVGLLAHSTRGAAQPQQLDISCSGVSHVQADARGSMAPSFEHAKVVHWILLCSLASCLTRST